mmetsp:Transcript_37499/g.79093  ORF Transcript_37499/g.79093 Transcript_37499/m.79093 type:complete len:120 (+) Transcript_37499:596-955(+)
MPHSFRVSSIALLTIFRAVQFCEWVSCSPSEWPCDTKCERTYASFLHVEAIVPTTSLALQYFILINPPVDYLSVSCGYNALPENLQDMFDTTPVQMITCFDHSQVHVRNFVSGYGFRCW